MESDLLFYRIWYRKEVSPKLSKEEKRVVLSKISAISLQEPIQLRGVTVPHSALPELRRFSKTSAFSGQQLYVVMKEIFNELYGVKLGGWFGEPVRHSVVQKKR